MNFEESHKMIKFSPIIDFNGYMNLPPMINISQVRYNTILEIYNYLLEYSKEELNKIITYFTYIDISNESFNQNILIKASMLEEMIHKKTIVSIRRNIDSQAELNMFYYIYLHQTIQNIKDKSILKNTYIDLDELKSNSIYYRYLVPLLKIKHSIKTCNLESYYTKLSILEELMIKEENDSRQVSSNQEIRMLHWLGENIKNFNIDNDKTIIHNGECNQTPYKCIECCDDCNGIPDLAFKTCGHMCLCLNCARKMKYKNICPICRQFSDMLIQIRNPF